MKTIIAGGRDYKFTKEDILFLESIKSEISEVVSGKAKGADTEGENWARKNRIHVKEFPAEWKNLNASNSLIKEGKYGKYNSLAGINRNAEMAKYADSVVLFSGGSGTKHMHDTALAYNLKIFDRRKKFEVENHELLESKRIVHCKKEKFDVYIGRPSKWGNPFVIGKDGTRGEVIEKYRRWILNQPELMKSLVELKNKTLGCWCDPSPCHGEVLIELSNKIEKW